jgi:hypothetical protein
MNEFLPIPLLNIPLEDNFYSLLMLVLAVWGMEAAGSQNLTYKQRKLSS